MSVFTYCMISSIWKLKVEKLSPCSDKPLLLRESTQNYLYSLWHLKSVQHEDQGTESNKTFQIQGGIFSLFLKIIKILLQKLFVLFWWDTAVTLIAFLFKRAKWWKTSNVFTNRIPSPSYTVIFFSNLFLFSGLCILFQINLPHKSLVTIVQVKALHWSSTDERVGNSINFLF